MNFAYRSDVSRADRRSGDRRRGSVWVRGGSLQVRVFAGIDPVTRRDRYLSETVEGSDRPARREAEKVMARLQTEVDGQRSAQSSVTLGYTLDEWLKTLEVEDSTRDGYIGYIERNIRPTLGAVPIAKLSTRTLETFYAELRRCRARCDAPLVHRARVQADGRIDRPTGPRGDQRRVERGRAVGLDRGQSGPRSCTTPAGAAPARPPVAGGRRPDRRWRVRGGRRLGHARMAGDDDWHAPGRGVRAPFASVWSSAVDRSWAA